MSLSVNYFRRSLTDTLATGGNQQVIVDNRVESVLLIYCMCGRACESRTCGHSYFYHISVAGNFLYRSAITMQFSVIFKHLIGFVVNILV